MFHDEESDTWVCKARWKTIFCSGVNLHFAEMKLQAMICQISKFIPALVFIDDQEVLFLTHKGEILTFYSIWREHLTISHNSNPMYVRHSCVSEIRIPGTCFYHPCPICLATDVTEGCLPRKYLFSMVCSVHAIKISEYDFEKFMGHFFSIFCMRGYCLSVSSENFNYC